MAETPWITDTIARTSAAPLQATDFMRVGRSTTSMKATMADVATYVAAGMAAMAVFATTIELGHASDTTLSRVAAGRAAIEGHEIATLDQTQTFTGVKTLTTPVLGVATATSINKVAITAPATGATLTIAEGKTLTASNTITFTATDGSTLAIGTGGTLGTAAYATIGTSGDTVPKNNTANTWSATQRFNNGSYVLLGTSGSAHMYVGHDGTNIIHQRYNAAGTLQDTPITINLSSGLITVGTLTGTISSPTLSGTVAGSVTFSGVINFATASIPLTVNSTNSNVYKIGLLDNGSVRGYLGADATYALYIGDGSANTRVRVNASTGAIDIGGNTVLTTATGAQLATANAFGGTGDVGNTFGNNTSTTTALIVRGGQGSSGVMFVNASAGQYHLAFQTGGTTRAWIGASSSELIFMGADTTARMQMAAAGGLIIGNPTGGNKGDGTLNATAVYDDNVLLTCYVFDAANDNGVVDTAKWDVKAPGGRHAPLRKFVSRLGSEYDPLDIDAYAKHWKDKRHLTSMPNEARFKHGDMATGEWIQRLIETVEIQAVHIDTLNQRLKLLEAA